MTSERSAATQTALTALRRAATLLEAYAATAPPPATIAQARAEIEAAAALLHPQPQLPQPSGIFQAVVESVHDFGVFTLDCAGLVTTWNPGAARIFGYSDGEILGWPVDILFTEEDRAAGAPAAERSKAEQHGRADDKRWHLRKDGSLFWADGVVTPLRSAGGTMIGFVKILRDATEQHHLEIEREQLLQQLSAERALLATTLQQMPSGVAIAEAPSGKLLMHNDTAIRLLGHPMLNAPTYEAYIQYGALHADGQPYLGHEYPIARAVRGETVAFEEMRYRRGDGRLTTFLVSAAPVRDTQGGIVAAVSAFLDIDNEKRSQEERVRLLAAEQQARAEAEAAVQTRDAFLAIAAHELRTPLTALSGNVQVLRRRLQRLDMSDERLNAIATALENQTRRLSQLIDSLFDVSRLEVGAAHLDRATVELCALTEQVIEEISPQLERHAIALDAQQCPALVLGDALRLEQVLYNLLQNAVKYSPNGGQITVTISLSGQEICWQIHDEGIGIPAAARQRLFERFYRAENAVALPISGMGIGLFVVHELVRLHGGRVEVSGEVGQGTTFTVWLPQAMGASGAA